MKYISSLSIVLLFCATLTAQSPNKIKKEADQLFASKNYEKSLNEYNKIKNKYTKDIDIKYKIGVCYFYTNNMDEAIIYLKFYSQNSPKLAPLTNYYIARAYHHQNNFRTAVHYYKNHLRTLASNAPERERLKRLIIQCTNGPKVEQINSGAIVATLGTKINSNADDYRICFNPRVANTIFFSSTRNTATGGKLNQNNIPDPINGHYRSDIYKSTLNQGSWMDATPLSSRYNTNMSEDIISFFDNGYQMLLLKGFADGHKEIVKENYDDDSIEVILPFALNASSHHWDGDHFFVSDSLMLFSSNRPGGYGGRDLYYSIQTNGQWQIPVNLGPKINTEYDEDAPFLAKNGRHLYFSSDHPLSMGGYDIYKAIFDDSTRTWKPRQNLGVPINSSADDKNFFLDKDGLKAYFSSNRIGGLGGFDLYSAYFRTRQQEQLQAQTPNHFVAVLTNITSLVDNTPISHTVKKLTPTATVDPTTTSGAKTVYNISPIYYNAQTGKIEGARNTILALKKLLARHSEAMIVLSGHTDHSGNSINDLYLTIKQAEELSNELIENNSQNKQIWIRGCGQNYPIANNQNFDGSPNHIGEKMNRRINVDVYNIAHLKDEMSINIIAPKVSSVMQNLAYTRYQKQLKGLTYKVQVTETATLFNHSIFKEFQHATTEKHPKDVNVKYMIGLENSFVAIKRTLDQVIQKGFPDAEIIPYINGIRITEDEAQVLFTEYPDLKQLLEYRSN
ncbi:OmpA family protein [Aureispira anguillae]|uniref:OmpA-like domain-containing protein n=1 Tax=Aureispira anguillae TaxID=2864201 RepID=A0A915YDL1_9BACT|nr:OmpA family protein [Aureispira anguillae]BDS11144.1 hypothetical protein AsAng_0018550 [Aureispira anguillae]